MTPRPSLRPVDWLLAAIIGLFLAGAVIVQAPSAPTAAVRSIDDASWAWWSWRTQAQASPLPASPVTKGIRFSVEGD